MLKVWPQAPKGGRHSIITKLYLLILSPNISKKKLYQFSVRPDLQCMYYTRSSRTTNVVFNGKLSSFTYISTILEVNLYRKKSHLL